MGNSINLANLQTLAAPHFADWERAGIVEDFDLAKRAWKNIRLLARSATTEIAHMTGTGGLYVFADTTKPDGEFGRLCYVGLAKHQDLPTRLSDYLIKELSILDRNLLRLDEKEAREEIHRRIYTLMPNSKKLDSYAKKHMKSWRISRANTVFLYPNSASPSRIEAAETLLIRTATDAGAQLVNISKMRSALPTDGLGLDVALGAINQWHEQGLGERLCVKWSAAIARASASL